MPKTWIDTAIPIALIVVTAGFFYIKLKLGKYVIKLIEWLKENLKSKKHKEAPSNEYEYIDYS